MFTVGNVDLCHGISYRSLYILSQKVIEFTQYGLFLHNQLT